MANMLTIYVNLSPKVVLWRYTYYLFPMKYFSLVVALFLSLSLGAQDMTDSATAVEQAVAEQTALYSLTADQQESMRLIEERRLRNLAEIEPLRSSNYRLFLEKSKSNRVNTEGSIRRMLTPDQREIHDQQLIQYRQETSDMIKQLRQEGKSKEEIELRLLEREQG